MNKTLYDRVRKAARYCRQAEMRKKINMFLEVISGRTVKQVCQRYGVSRSSYYRWWNRFKERDYSIEGLKPLSRRPKRSPQQKNKYVTEVIKKYRIHYRYGPERILDYIKRNHRIEVSRSTIWRTIERNGWILKKYRTKKKNPHQKRYSLPWPGMCMQLDIKYVPRKIAGQQYYVFNAIDDCTRWRFAQAYPDKSKLSAVHFVRDLVRNTPFKIKAIQTDNDSAFTYRLIPSAVGKRHPFASTLEEYDIEHYLIPPGIKELNGKVERSHRTDDEEFYWKAPLHSFGLLKHHLQLWIYEYNYDRGHGSLERNTPIETLVEKMLLQTFILAFYFGFQLDSLIKVKHRRFHLVDTYLKFLDWDYSVKLPCLICGGTLHTSWT